MQNLFRKTPLHRRILSALVFCLALPSATLFAQTGAGDLTVTPTRAVFEGRDRSTQISLINRGTATATYRVSFIQMRMAEDGQFEEITEPGPGEHFADALIRYSPRQVTLEPGVAQTVRLMLRKPADLAPGEYRSHMIFHAVPDADAGTSIENVELEGEEFDIRLTPIYRISIPVIVRHGELTAEAELGDVGLVTRDGESPPGLALRLHRRGERSIYGDVDVTWIPDGGDPEVVVGQIKGLAVYSPNASRSLVLPLRPPAGVELENGRLKVTFSEEPSAHGAASSEVDIRLDR